MQRNNSGTFAHFGRIDYVTTERGYILNACFT
jgi:hypothetical protein